MSPCPLFEAVGRRVELGVPVELASNLFSELIRQFPLYVLKLTRIGLCAINAALFE